MEITLEGFVFAGGDSPNVQATIAEISGWLGDVGVKGQVVARPANHGDFSTRKYRSGRVLSWSGLLFSRSMFDQQMLMARLAGIAADGGLYRGTVQADGGSFWFDYELVEMQSEVLVPGATARYQIQVRCPDPRLYGESRPFRSVPLSVFAPGPGGHGSEYSFGSNTSVAPSSTDSSGRLIAITPGTGTIATREVYGPLRSVRVGETLHVDFRASWVGASILTRFNVFMYWYDSAGDPLTESRTLVYDSMGTVAVTDQELTVTVPAGAAQARVRFYSYPDAGAEGQRAFLNLSVRTAVERSTVHHKGNFPADPVVTVRGPRSAPYTITGPGGRVVTVTQSLTSAQTHTIDFGKGSIHRGSSRRMGAMTHFQPWQIPAGQRVQMSISSGSMTVEVTDTYI